MRTFMLWTFPAAFVASWYVCTMAELADKARTYTTLEAERR
jgi:hypothetical protein